MEKQLIYENLFEDESSLKDFVMEGKAKVRAEGGCLSMENALPRENGQKANYVLWCRQNFPSDIEIAWDFKPIRQPGLCILFFAAKGRNGEDIFAPSLSKRDGQYPEYHHGDINAFHVSYFRRKEDDERAFHTCNLRKSYGFHLVAQGADPIPDLPDGDRYYHLCLIKKDNCISFSVNDLEVFHFKDDGKTYGPCLGGGKIGFRQLAPLSAQYRNFKVFAI